MEKLNVYYNGKVVGYFLFTESLCLMEKDKRNSSNLFSDWIGENR